ncbi:MAG: glycosyltransferase [Ignavibacteriaceae bacterium]|nr:glycosyltransferase [Ignavibacteriaceae bacterium]
MRILLLADANSPHTSKWAISLADLGHNVAIFSFSPSVTNLYDRYPNIKLFDAGISVSNFNSTEAHLSKIIYLKSITIVRQLIKKIMPQIVHAHYASSYGLVGALSNFHPFFISAWGSDVLSFPNRSIIHRLILKFNFFKADKIFSTSKIMGEKLIEYTSKPIVIIPFGVDLKLFKAESKKSELLLNEITIGTVKSLEKNYGIDLLIKSFNMVKTKLPNLKLRLLIVGSGKDEIEFKKLSENLGLKNDVHFTGYIKHSEVPRYFNLMDIAVFLTRGTESFGVSVLEASACEKPVVVTNIGGLPEVVDDNITGYIVEAGNIGQAASAIEKLILDRELRTILGKNGRHMVEQRYDWKQSVNQMIKMYESVLDDSINRVCQ